MAVHGTQDPDTNVDLAHTLGRNQGQENAVLVPEDDSEGVTERDVRFMRQFHGLPVDPLCMAFSSKDHGQDASEELSPTLRAAGHSDSHANAGAPPAVAYAGFDILGTPASEVAKEADVHTPLRARVPGQFENSTVTMVANGMEVRRLTPVECERLQGFPDNHTLIPVGKKKKITADEYAYLRHHIPGITAEEAYRQAVDGPRYKAIGNSMAVPCMAWIGKRILQQLEGAL
jgi:DNA (cytosine-5)-methyltransferase 1